MDLKLHLRLLSKTIKKKKHKNKQEKYIYEDFSMDFTNIKLPK